MRAGVLHGQIEINFRAKDGLFEGDFDGCLYVLAAVLAAASAAFSAKKTAKDIAQAQIAKIKAEVLGSAAKTGERIAVAGGAAAHTRVAELVVALALGIIFQDLVGFIDLFELIRAAPAVRVILHGQPPVGFFNLVRAGAFANA